MTDFDRQMERHQVEWRRSNIRNQEPGIQNKVSRDWILPEHLWEEALWQELCPSGRDPVRDYLEEKRIQKYRGFII
jgi:hypothetical protein